MKKIQFLNSLGWEQVKVEGWDGEGNAVPPESEQLQSLSFSGDGVQTGKVFPGELALTVDYKKIPSYPTPLTFLCTEKSTGHVDTYVLQDEENLRYRPQCSKKINVFGKSHIDEVAAQFGLPVLARLPIDPNVAEAFDNGLMETVDTAAVADVIEAIKNAE